VIALHGLKKTKNKIAKLKKKVPAAKRWWKISWDDRRQKEAYLGYSISLVLMSSAIVVMNFIIARKKNGASPQRKSCWWID
jgi:hypothetical protein